MTHLDRLIKDMAETLKSVQANIKNGDTEGAANILLCFVEDVTRYGDTAELLLEEE